MTHPSGAPSGTLQFFQAILPETGNYFLARIKGKTVVHIPAASLTELAALVPTAEQTYPDWQIYHACASYLNPFITTPEGRTEWRKQPNWSRAKSLWIDVDAGADKAAKGKGYATKGDALNAVKKFCQGHKMPTPWVVDSGNGIHCYWTLTKAISHAKWLLIATALKNLTSSAGLLVDPSRTTDFASILRPPGSFHKKDGRKVVDVKVRGVASTPEDLWAVLKPYLKAVPQPKAAPTRKLKINEDLTSFLSGDYLPVSIEVIANHCGQVDKMRATKGDVSYDHWRGVIGLAKYSIEGIKIAHEWSEGYQGYDPAEVDEKFEGWNTPPTTCNYFSDKNPNGCKGCRYSGKITSPISLGKVAKSEESIAVETPEGEEVSVKIPSLPDGFAYNNETLSRYIRNKEAITIAIPFCKTLIYPLQRIRKGSGEYAMRMRMHLPDRTTREFDIDTGALAAQADILKSLAKFEVVPMNNPDAPTHLTAYLRDSLEVLKKEAKEVKTYEHFGWHTEETEFLIGNTLYTKDGPQKVLTAGAAKKLEHAFQAVGTVEGYAEGLNGLYGRKGMEPMQYMIASGFGSPLTPFIDTLYKGLITGITGGDTAKGKTTVCNSALYAFGNAEKLQLSGEMGATMNARYAFLGAFKNIPILMDELTNLESAQLSELSYQISMGQEKHRLQARSGNVQFADNNSWGMSPFVTANDDLHSKLACHQANSQAEAVRMIQIHIDNYPETMIDSAEVEKYRRLMEVNMGVAGRRYIECLVRNKDKIVKLLHKIHDKLHTDIKESRLRFYRSHAACSLTAAYITNKLGITNFDLKNLYGFAVKTLNELAQTVAQQNTLGMEDALSDLVSAVAPMSITTYRVTDRREGNGSDPILKGPPAGVAPQGRIILEQQEMYITRKAVRNWCKDNRINFVGLVKYGTERGLVESPEGKICIGKGTELASGNASCILIKLNKVNSDVMRMAKQHLRAV